MLRVLFSPDYMYITGLKVSELGTNGLKSLLESLISDLLLLKRDVDHNRFERANRKTIYLDVNTEVCINDFINNREK